MTATNQHPSSSDQALDQHQQNNPSSSPPEGVVVTYHNAALWTRAEALQAPTGFLFHQFNTRLPDLVSAIQENLGSTNIAGLTIDWDCEMFLAGSVKNDTAIGGTDLDVLVALKPRVAGYSVRVGLESSTCSLVLTSESSSTSKSIRVIIDDGSLWKIWQAFVASVQEFAEQYHSILNIPEIRPREWAKFEDDPAGQMWASFSFGTTHVDVLPAFKTAVNVFLMLLRSCKPDGSNIVKSFSHFGARRIASLPDKAKHLICALKHVVKVVHGFEVPGSMFESVVLEVFEQQGWIGDLDEVQSASISFIEAWRLCWRRILSWRPISAPNKSLEEDVDLLSLIDKTELTRVGEALSSIDEKSLLDECLNGTRESLARLIESRSQYSPSTSSPLLVSPPTRSSAGTTNLPATNEETSGLQSVSSIARDASTAGHLPLASTPAQPMASTTSLFTFSLRRWLEAIKLSEYQQTFESNGFADDDLDNIADLTERDLDILGITLLGHRKTILREAEKLKRGGASS